MCGGCVRFKLDIIAVNPALRFIFQDPRYILPFTSLLYPPPWGILGVWGGAGFVTIFLLKCICLVFHIHKMTPDSG